MIRPAECLSYTAHRHGHGGEQGVMGKGPDIQRHSQLQCENSNIHLCVAQGDHFGGERKSGARRVGSTSWNLRQLGGKEKHDGGGGNHVLCWVVE